MDAGTVLRVALGAALCWLALVVVAWAAQRHLIYLPMGGPVVPAAAVLPGARDVRIPTEDGLELGGWLVPAQGGGGLTVIVFNGNAGDRSMRAPLATALARHGLSVLLFDYRGFGGNAGRPSERGLHLDARAAWGFVTGTAGVDPGRVVLFGESLGCAVAVGLAREHPPHALVLRSPFTSLGDVGRWHYPFLPVRLLLRDRFPCRERIRHVRAPVLVIAGERDGIVPASQSRAVADAAGGPVRSVEIPGADHNDAALLDGDRMIAEIVSFLGP